jgi:hypothetical protein
MTRDQAADLLILVKSEYPREIVNAERVALWFGALASVDYAAAVEAFGAHLADSERGSYCPHPADLLRHVRAAAPAIGPAPALDRIDSPDADATAYVLNRWDDETLSYQRIATPVRFDRRLAGDYERATLESLRVPFRLPKRQPSTPALATA